MSLKTVILGEVKTPGHWKKLLGTVACCGVLGGVGRLLWDSVQTEPLPPGLSHLVHLRFDPEVENSLVSLWKLAEMHLVTFSQIRNLATGFNLMIWIQHQARNQRDVLIADLSWHSRAFHVSEFIKDLLGQFGENLPIHESARQETIELLQNLYETNQELLTDVSASHLNMLHCLHDYHE